MIQPFNDMKKDIHPANGAGESSLERVNAFSDGVFAIIITIMVLDLKKPEDATFRALGRLWPTWVSYLVSYGFIAIVWVNHHYLSRYAKEATSRFIWTNFGHMFSVALIPFLTAWIADTHLAPVPVAMYAFVFFLVNLTYLILVYETLCNDADSPLSDKTRRLLHVRSLSTLLLFLTAMVLAFWFPLLGFTIICCCLLLYLRPDVPHVQRLVGNPKEDLDKNSI
jgi:uncharacterized membrane protein